MSELIMVRDYRYCYWSEDVQDMGATYTCCRLREKAGDLKPVGYKDCAECPEYHSKYKKTKGDEMREMSDTELMNFMSIICRACPPVPIEREQCAKIFKVMGRCDGDPELCKKCWGAWLREEAAAT